MSSSVLFAVKRAIEDARKDIGNSDVLILSKKTIACIISIIIVFFF